MLKVMVTTPLGALNYLAAFLVFLFNVARYRRSALAILFALFVFITMSRSGVAFLGVSVTVWVLTQLRTAAVDAEARLDGLGGDRVWHVMCQNRVFG
jgi:hypothetical protein